MIKWTTSDVYFYESVIVIMIDMVTSVELNVVLVEDSFTYAKNRRRKFAIHKIVYCRHHSI